MTVFICKHERDGFKIIIVDKGFQITFAVLLDLGGRCPPNHLPKGRWSLWKPKIFVTTFRLINRKKANVINYMNVSIEKAKSLHLQDIAEIEKEIFTTPWSLDNIASVFKNENNCIFVAIDNDSGKTAGHICLETVLDEGTLSAVAVKEEYRKKGIAMMLMDSLIGEAAKRQLSYINLEVRVSNMPAIALYKKYGFEKNGLRKNYYKKPTENALLMVLTLKR